MSAWESELARECIRLYGEHNTIIEQKGTTGFLRYCRMCGTGEWTNTKREVGPEEETHKIVFVEEV